ncbi:unnamed protein product, partial [Ceratitis capitata]
MKQKYRQIKTEDTQSKSQKNVKSRQVKQIQSGVCSELEKYAVKRLEKISAASNAGDCRTRG